MTLFVCLRVINALCIKRYTETYVNNAKFSNIIKVQNLPTVNLM